jgi:hypothetical protein
MDDRASRSDGGVRIIRRNVEAKETVAFHNDWMRLHLVGAPELEFHAKEARGRAIHSPIVTHVAQG